MEEYKNLMEWQKLKARWYEVALILGSILIITFLHYSTSSMEHGFHDYYRRLYYLPIIVAALRFGVWGGLSASFLSTLLYIPHAFLLPTNMDPQNNTDKILEIALYNVIALVTGWLYERIIKENVRHKRTADELKDSLEHIEKVQYQLRIAERMAAIGQLSAGLAHEIRNPLASIQGTAEILKDEFPPEHRKFEMANILIEESQRLNTILNRFLMFARPHKIVPTKVNVHDELKSIVELLRYSNSYNDHRIEVDIAEDVETVTADSAGLRQVLLNLGLNALEAMEEGGTLKILVRQLGSDNKNFLEFAVIDDGPGLDAETKERMFNPFYSTKESGSGLGLSIVRRIVEDHGGSIECESENGKGTTVSICFPERDE